MARINILVVVFSFVFLSLLLPVSAQFDGFFQQMFGAGEQQQQPQDSPSTPEWYRQNYEAARCSKYLCPGTLACVHFPHHCPCAFEKHEEKVELGEGIAICASKGGFKEGETLRKVELARKGYL
ncbi:hypothetical protein P152DRAFT_458734 [Eremomyces bilateralis CBS 781.70]|uniref:Long chronological lifespan protein 2 n=1 Tax=Eremomyces bilateralis CBS 781.70 TaxID=1392243 RepID=A0A6G1G3H0_9PEZI|nr:uncharacterized protein P152DRAFT_458734 [Eremomyces bilateralis CBS 781.70]KAF1812359.1 hypothetical protein P152DRAFT_458734 [Eremomyces bilateralis CBS 781.70]